MDTVVILSIVFPENISKFFSMYGYGFLIGRVFPKRIFKVISMYEHIFFLYWPYVSKKDCQGL